MVKRFAFVAALCLALLAGSGAGYVFGNYRAAYRQACFDLAFGLSTEAKLRAEHTEALRADNDFRIMTAYRTIQSLPEWLARVQRDSVPVSERKVEEGAVLLHDVLSRRSDFQISEADAREFVSRHVGSSESFQY